MSALELWFYFTVLPNLETAADALTFVSAMAFILLLFISVIFDDDARKAEAVERRAAAVSKRWWIALTVLVCSITVGVLAPTERQIAMIVGGYVATNIEGVEKLPANVVRAANAFLERLANEE